MTFSSNNTAMHATPDREALRRRESARDLAEALNWLLPFHFFYEKGGIPLPDFHFMPGEEVPYPYRSLLVHSNDMTPTLAAFHHSKLYLEVHEHESSDDFVMRLVTLHAASSDIPVEFGAIAIQLGGLPGEMQEQVVAGSKPLGALLGEFGVEHYGSPSAYFAVPADERIAKALNQSEGEILYGRCNQLLDRDGIVFADIVEILPRSNESEKWVQHVTSR
jgi:chorismate-pyruvate lyase